MAAGLSFAPRPLERLSALGRHDRLAARCVRCGHVHHLDPAVLRGRYGDLDMASLRARLCCGVCGGRHPELVRSWAPPVRDDSP
jgi:hypothetical protein